MRRSLMAFLVLLCTFAADALAEPPIPALTGRVVDQAGILGTLEIDTITRQLAGYESATGNQVVVVTLPDLKGYPIEDWGLALGRGWGIGQQGKNNGVLLIVAPNDRELRIEVGYGLEGDLPDATANSIIQQEIVPFFKRGDLSGGVHAGVNAILSALGGKYTPRQAVSAAPEGGFQQVLPALLIFAAFFAFIVMSSFKRRYDYRQKRMRWMWIPPDINSGSSGGISSGRSSGSRSSGGGFSGGGGSFGGGGASGRW